MQTLKSSVSRSVARAAPRSRALRITCQAQGNGVVQQASLAAATAFAAATLMASPAMAGVVLESPKLKKSFLDGGSLLPTASAPAAGSSSDASSQPKAPKPSPERTSTFEEGPDVRTLALPGALLFVGGLGALTFFSAELTGFMEANFVKDSTVLGVGQETDYVKFDFVPKRTITNRGGTKKTTVKGKGLFGSKK